MTTGVLRDLRYALRLIVRRPGFSGVVIFALALGIGANTAIFTAVNDFLLQPLPFADAGRLVSVVARGQGGMQGGWTSPRDYMDWAQQNHVFSGMAGWSEPNGGGLNLTGRGEAERVPGLRVTASFLPVLGVSPMRGRNFLAAEDFPKAARVAIISYSLWQRRFGGKADILGQAAIFNGEAYSIIGVMPAGFRFSNAMEDVFLPLQLNPASTYRGSMYVRVIARLKPGVKLERAQAEVSAIVEAIGRQYPNYKIPGVTVEGLRDGMVRQVRPALLALLGAVGLVLLIACANAANMLLARAAARERETAVRRALGAGPGRLVRQTLVESVVLALMGGAAGLLCAVWGIPLLYNVIPASLQPPVAAGINWTVLIFTALIALATGVLFGLAPAWNAVRGSVAESLKEGSWSQGAGGRQRLRGWLVSSEVALSVVLLAGAGLLIKSFVRLAAVDPGFRPENVVTMKIQRQKGTGPFCSQVIERAAGLPGVVAAGAVSGLPMSGMDWGQNLTVPGRPFRGEKDYVWACHRIASRDYFRAAGMRLLGGRTFDGTDTREKPAVVVVNEAFAKAAWPGGEAVGKSFIIGEYPSEARPTTVIGVVADAKFNGLAEDSFPEMFFSMEQGGANNQMTFVVRTGREAHGMIGPLRGIIREIDPNQPVTAVRMLESVVADSIAPQRLVVLLGAIFAALALVLAGTGLYGVVSYSVVQRTHEIGVRMAMGARRAEVVRLVVAEALAFTAAGTAVGVAAALALGKVLSGLLFRVSPRDPLILGAVCAVLAAVALAASYLPARRAAEIDPMAALRYQ